MGAFTSAMGRSPSADSRYLGGDQHRQDMGLLLNASLDAGQTLVGRYLTCPQFGYPGFQFGQLSAHRGAELVDGLQDFRFIVHGAPRLIPRPMMRHLTAGVKAGSGAARYESTQTASENNAAPHAERPSFPGKWRQGDESGEPALPHAELLLVGLIGSLRGDFLVVADDDQSGSGRGFGCFNDDILGLDLAKVRFGGAEK